MGDDVQYHIFPSGLRLVYRHLPSPVTYIGVMVGAGTRDELPTQNGLAHYIEHGLFKGTPTRTATQIINRIENVGGELNAYTTKEETALYAAVPSHYTARTMELIADMLLNSVFPEEEMEKEKQVIFDEIESYNDSPSELIYDDFEALLFSGHPLESPVLGTKKVIRRFRAFTARRFISRNYTPARTVLFAETSKPLAEIIRLAEEFFSQFTASSDSVVRTSPVFSVSTPRTATYRRHTHQTHAMLGAPACHIGHPDRLATALLNNILGGGAMNSRLNMTLREKYGLVYTVESVFQPLSDTGYWAVYFASEPENAERCIDLIREQLALLAAEPLARHALRKAIAQIKGQMAIAEENRENRVLAMAKNVLYLNRVIPLRRTIEALKDITAEQLQDLAARTFNPNKIFILQYN